MQQSGEIDCECCPDAYLSFYIDGSLVLFYNGGTGDEAWRGLDTQYMYEGTFDDEANVWALPEKTEIRLVINGNTVDGEASASFGGYLIDNGTESIL